jgi:hypothetical protein
MGTGFEKQGVERVDWFWKALEHADGVMFPWTNSGDLVDFLRKKGHAVWGAGFAAEQLELDRIQEKHVQHDAGLPVGNYEVVRGIEKLLERLKVVKDVYVKFSTFREIETFKHTDWESTLAQHVGPIVDAYGADPTVEVLLEQELKGPECGSDAIIINGQMLQPVPWGWEDKDNVYIAHFPKANEPHPPGMEKVLSALEPYFKDATTFMSTEGHMSLNGTMTVNDLTVRTPHPPLGCMIEGISNLAAIVANGIKGKTTPPTYPYRYAMCFVIYSNHNFEHYTEVTFPAKFRQQVKLHRCKLENGHYYVCPGGEILGQVVAVGNTVDACIKDIKLVAEAIHAKELVFDFDSMYRLRDKVIPEGKKHGIPF